jgi:hypothetical protein
MHPPLKHLAWICLVLAHARDLRADPVDELRLADGIRFGAFGITIGDTRTVRDREVAKVAGSLDLQLPASAFDPALSFTLQLHGAKHGPGLVRWAFDETLSPPQIIDEGVAITRLRGELVGAVWRVPAALTQECDGACAHGVSIRQAAGSWVRIELATPSGAQQLLYTGIRFSAFGGFPRPVLAKIAIDTTTCPRTTPRIASGTVVLETPAPAGGAIVPITSSLPSQVRVHAVVVPHGHTTAAFEIGLTPQWTGSATLAAVSGGTERTTTLECR